MALYSLLREYEDRRQALIDQLKKNPNMDPAVQHQIYGAIKEIENFLKTIEFHITASQEKGVGIELSRDRPRPLVEKTKKLASKVKSGTKKVAGRVKDRAQKFKAKRQKKKEERRMKRKLKKDIERELLARLQKTAAKADKLPGHVHEGPSSSDRLPVISNGKLEPESSGKSELMKDEPRQEAEPKKKPRKKLAKKAKKARKKPKKKKRKR